MTRPPKVSAALLRQQNTKGPGVAATRQAASESHFAVAQTPDTTKSTGMARHPLGVLPNTLPSMWLAWRGEDLLVMEETASGQRCLAIIPGNVLVKARAAQQVMQLDEIPQ